jgi:hypothetical protein
MELVDSVDIFREREFILTAKELKKLRRKKIISLEAYVYLALKLQYGERSHLNIHSESFCKDWGLLPHEVGAAFAKLQKKELIGCNAPTTIQLELFRLDDEE